MPLFHRNLIARRLGLPPAQFNVGIERNLRVPMPDGVTLRTDRWFPKAGGSFPTILMRSPYSGGRLLRTDLPGLFDFLFGPLFAERGYHFLAQTTRGRFDAEGKFEPMITEAEDGRATMEWIGRQPWFNGSLGLWGPSYLGYVQWAAAPGAPASLRAIVPTFAASRFSTTFFPDGALGETPLQWAYLMDVANRSKWATLESLRRANPQALERALTPAFNHLPAGEADVVAVGKPIDYYREWVAHARLEDPYWAKFDHHTRISQITAPAHLITGWHDFFVRDLLADYAALKAAGREPYLTIGPEGHGPAGAFASLAPGLIWFDAHLKGDRSRLREKPVRIYVMDTNREAWREMDSWPPPARETRYFLQSGRRLSSDGPEADSVPDAYRYDPADPTPSVAGPGLTATVAPVDNRPLESRPDVLTFTTPPLVAALDVIGPVRLELYVRSSLAHTDFFGRLC
ncbi:MAG: CocE/NonD family hydrolase, partial [Chloroflexi bacterium]|nr:CocE/NonD family hydrolase [Chloroflexota bacterium]